MVTIHYIAVTNCAQCPHVIFPIVIWRDQYQCGYRDEARRVLDGDKLRKEIPEWCELPVLVVN